MKCYCLLDYFTNKKQFYILHSALIRRSDTYLEDQSAFVYISEYSIEFTLPLFMHHKPFCVCEDIIEPVVECFHRSDEE